MKDIDIVVDSERDVHRSKYLYNKQVLIMHMHMSKIILHRDISSLN